MITIPRTSNDQTQQCNRRPINFPPDLPKLCESVIRDQLDFAEEQNLLKSNQFGFRGRLTAAYQSSHLAAHVEDNLCHRKKIMAVMLDVAKGYDRISRDGLLHKLVVLGFPWNLCLLVGAWITGRNFTVKVESNLSSTRTAQEDHPQGSASSFLLFNIYVQDMPTFPTNTAIRTLQFADDSALVVIGRNVESARNRARKGYLKLRSRMEN